jgi:3-oxoacyl-[acyl-carrier-protein] synthase II
MSRRVAITGLGVHTSIGSTVDEFWRACLETRTAVAPIPAKWRDFYRCNSPIWSPLPAEPGGDEIVNDIERTKLDRVAVIAMRTAAAALANAGVDFERIDTKHNRFALRGVAAERIGVCIGTGVGGVTSLLSNAAFHMLSKQVPRLEDVATQLPADAPGRDVIAGMRSDILIPFRANPFTVSMIMPNAVSANVAIKFGIRGPAQTACSACASGTVALGAALEAVRSGAVDMAIAGGAEYLGDDYGIVYRGFDMARTLAVREHPALADDALNRPFDAGRSGFLFSEGGCGILVLEDLDRARARGATILCELAGYAETCDGSNIMMIDPETGQIERMLAGLLSAAGLRPEDVDYVNAHGTGTKLNDDVEAAMIGRVFGTRPLVNSTKALLGHTIGASGALGAIVAALSIRDGTTHACRNLAAPIADLNFVRGPVRQPIRAAVAQAFAFGGHNAAVLLRAVDRG